VVGANSVRNGYEGNVAATRSPLDTSNADTSGVREVSALRKRRGLQLDRALRGRVGGGEQNAN
jgi:hypothetical protein